MSRIFLRTWLTAAIVVFTAQLRAAETMPLAGEWRFALDRADAGVNEKWFTKDLSDKIQLPGILQAQGYGDDITTNTPWVLTLGDAWWNMQPASLREHFSQPGHVEVPFLSQPQKHYLGVAWYQRDIDIPTNWSGKHFTLFLERAHWKSTVWLDGKEIGSDISLSTPHEFELTNVAPGKYRLTLRVDNRTQLPVAGHLVDSHSISDALGATWNGIVGKIELRATPPVWIEDVQIFPNLTNRTATIKVQIGNVTGTSGRGRLSVDSVIGKAVTVTGLSLGPVWASSDIPSEQPMTIDPSTGLPSGIPPGQIKWETSGITSATIEIRINDSDLWGESQFQASLQTIRVLLTGGSFNDSHEVSFGLREITTRDKDILINGQPVNLRLTHFGGEFPLTGYPAMDVASWKKIIQTCKDYGLNGIRFHSWCPPEAAFEAADELGFYLQPECGLWGDFGNAPTREFLEAETSRILKAYGNHPSFIMLSPSNEPRNYSRFTPQWAAENYAKDPRRLYSAGTGWADPSQVAPGGAQFATLVRFGDGQLRNTSGWFGSDYRDALAAVHIPVLAHEVGQWCAYPDFDVIKKFTGYLQPGNYEIFKYIAEQEGELDQDHAFAWASGRFQLECYKEEIEANLRTPGLAGFELLDLHDYLGQGTALIGVLDAFWESKGYVTADEFRSFSGPTVPLARLPRRVYTSDQTLESDVELYQFGSMPISDVGPFWEILDSSGKKVAGGEWKVRDIPIGKNIPLGKISADLSKLAAPAQYKLVIQLWISSSGKASGGPDYQNDWNFWLYPAKVSTATPSDVLVTHTWSEAATRLAAGGKVLFMPGAADLDPAKCPPMKNVPVFWNIQMTVRPPANRTAKFDAMLGLLCDTNHPALAEFPTEANCDWQWTPLVNNVRSVNLSQAPRSLRPIVSAIDDWNRNWRLGVIFECNVGPGKLLVSAIDLDNQRGGSGLKQLQRSLLDYMAGDKFKPAATLTPAEVASLWARGATAPPEPTRAFDPDLNDGTIPVPKKP